MVRRAVHKATSAVATCISLLLPITLLPLLVQAVLWVSPWLRWWLASCWVLASTHGCALTSCQSG